MPIALGQYRSYGSGDSDAAWHGAPVSLGLPKSGDCVSMAFCEEDEDLNRQMRNCLARGSSQETAPVKTLCSGPARLQTNAPQTFKYLSPSNFDTAEDVQEWMEQEGLTPCKERVPVVDLASSTSQCAGSTSTGYLGARCNLPIVPEAPTVGLHQQQVWQPSAITVGVPVATGTLVPVPVMSFQQHTVPTCLTFAETYPLRNNAAGRERQESRSPRRTHTSSIEKSAEPREEPYVTEEQWEERIRKRNQGLYDLRTSKVYTSNQDIQQERPVSPNPYDRSLSKRGWEKQIAGCRQEWRCIDSVRQLVDKGFEKSKAKTAWTKAGEDMDKAVFILGEQRLIQEMGFPRRQAVSALKRTAGDLDRAVQILLGQ